MSLKGVLVIEASPGLQTNGTEPDTALRHCNQREDSSAGCGEPIERRRRVCAEYLQDELARSDADEPTSSEVLAGGSLECLTHR